MIGVIGRAWAIALVALVAAGAGMSALTSSSSSTSLLRMALAAAVLSAYAAIASLVFMPRVDRTRFRCLVGGALVPALVGLVNTLLVAQQAGVVAGLVSGIPWLVGAAAVSTFGPLLPEVQLRRMLRQ